MRYHIVAFFQESGKLQFKGTVPDNAIKEALFGDKIFLILSHKWTRLPQHDVSVPAALQDISQVIVTETKGRSYWSPDPISLIFFRSETKAS